MTGSADVLRLAQNVARNCGWHVFSCRDDKRPACPHGFKDASNDPDEIAELWRRHPGPLVGVVTGAASGVSVLDIDVKHDESRAWWRRHEGRLPATRTYRTKSGGVHVVFRHAAGVRNVNGKPVHGVDVRGDGGYIVYWFAAGFECLDHAPPAPWPDWLTRFFWPPAAPAQHYQHARLTGERRPIDGVLRRLSDAAAGERNAILYWAAHRLRARIAVGAVTTSEAERDLLAAARKCGLADIEAQRTIASAWRSSP